MDKEFLTQLVAATDAGTVMYVSQTQGQPLVAAGLIEINSAITDPSDPTKIACRALPAAKTWLAQNAGGDTAAVHAVGNYQVMTGIELPAARKRGNISGGSGAPTKYPFADMPLNGVFFSGNSEHKNKDAVKGLSSTVSAQNDKYSDQLIKDGVPQTKTVTRAVRDKQTKKAQIGADGKKVTETVELPVKKYNRKFTIRPVAKGYKSGDWVAPEDGALIGRII